MSDRVGMGWRPELAAGIFDSLDDIDVLEVLAEDYLDEKSTRAVRSLARRVPVTLHGVSCGLASAEPVDDKRLEKIARVVGEVEPESWSEHLAFVRAGGREIGHLAAPSRTAQNIESARRNIERARNIVGSAPAMENIATLLKPPASELTEAEWIAGIVMEADCGLLLDLHNLHANCSNFGLDAIETLERLPLERVSLVHIAGGKPISASGETRILDDHLHPVPQDVYALLAELAARVEQPLTVVLERDGAYPAMDELVGELRAAREAMARGRAMRRERIAVNHVRGVAREDGAMQRFLAELYLNEETRKRFLRNAYTAAQTAGLTEAECRAMEAVDRTGLEMAARSFEKKRAAKGW